MDFFLLICTVSHTNGDLDFIQNLYSLHTSVIKSMMSLGALLNCSSVHNITCLLAVTACVSDEEMN